MDNSDHIARKIKEGFESVEHKAPEGLWAAINEGIKTKTNIIDEKVKSSFESSNESAPSAIWVGIDKQLTIDKGWIKVYKYLQLQTFYKWTKRVAALLLLLFFLTIGFKNYFDKKESIKLSHNKGAFLQMEKQPTKLNNPSKTILTEQQTNSNDSTNDVEQLDINNKVTQENNSTLSNATKTDVDLNYDISVLDKNPTLNSDKKIEKPAVISEINDDGENDSITIPLDAERTNNTILSDNFSTAKQINDSSLVVINTSDDKNNIDSLKNDYLANDSIINLLADQKTVKTEEGIENKDSLKTRFEFGFTTAINSTAIINNTTISSFNEESLYTFIPSFGINFGLQFVYHLNNNHGLVISLTHSSVNQAYYQFNRGRLNKEEINVNFFRLQPLYQFRYKRFEYRATALNIKAGPYFGVLTNSNPAIDKSIDYINYDLGITLQVGQNFEFTRFILDYGLNVDKGLTNLNKGTNQIPASFDKTTSLGLGLYLSLRYKF